MVAESNHELARETAHEVVKARRGQTARWVIGGSVLLAVLVLSGIWLGVYYASETLDEMRGLIRRQGRAEQRQRDFTRRQQARTNTLLLELARRGGVDIKGLKTSGSPAAIRGPSNGTHVNPGPDDNPKPRPTRSPPEPSPDDPPSPICFPEPIGCLDIDLTPIS